MGGPPGKGPGAAKRGPGKPGSKPKGAFGAKRPGGGPAFGGKRTAGEGSRGPRRDGDEGRTRIYGVARSDDRPRTGRNKEERAPDRRFLKTGKQRREAAPEDGTLAERSYADRPTAGRPRAERPSADRPYAERPRPARGRDDHAGEDRFREERPGQDRVRDARPRRDQPAPEPVEVATEAANLPPPTAVQTVTVTEDENGMRVDRFFEARFPGLSFSHIQRIVRKGQVRVNGKRVDTKDRLEAGQAVRVPPLRLDAPKPAGGSEADQKTRAFLKSITLFEDDDVLVLNKPMGLAVQGGSGTTRHVDGMLEVLRDAKGQRPRLVHRLDKDTAGCLLVAKTRFAASTLAKSFRSREARKVYWALVAGVPKPKQGRISTFLVKEEREDDSFMRIAKHGEEGATHAVTYYAVVETAAQQLAWLSLKPVTGRTHQLRAHMAHIGHPIVGDPKYFSIENWQLPGGVQNRLHLMARRLAIPHPRAGTIDVTAPIPAHMVQSWNLLGFDATRYDPIEDAPDED
ncbi:MAG: RluA family pseudouridine synthase [Rhodoplanes sp.]|uniref:RluA family pseudouridine synthase n=1 Tax=Rhodoplanes sp. TaxID=1968906 RepID=UPI0018501240|nr:RluA family pseudouridine synthase [Rhodoplanes sp.]NVO13714.1 RluA family pseudouridine synthase [Rhodoplanes sp.]